MLSDGGNAIDAAVAMAFAAAVVEPTEASIGGSGFMLAHDPASGNAWSVEFPPRAPLRATPDMYDPTGAAAGTRLLGAGDVRDDANATGWRAPCVPGAVAGLCLAHARFGTLPLPRLIDPAVELAERGFAVDAYLALRALENLEALRASPECRRILLRGDLPPTPPVATWPEADPPRLKQSELAQTLRAVGEEGADAFYRGEIAEAIHAAFEQCGGLLSRADLAGYRATIERPLSGSYRGWTVLGPRAPSGAWTVIQALQILDRTGPLAEWGTTSALHAVAEALQLAFVERYRAGGDTSEALDELLSESRAEHLARTIHPDRKSPITEAMAAHPWTQQGADLGHGTTHLCVIDAKGRIASCTLTAGNTFGAKVIAGETGVLFDSGMAWFDPRPGAANSIAPGKRPLVNMAPLLLLGGADRVALGAAGGRRIISAVTQVTSAIVDHGMPIQKAISAPRLDASERMVRVSDRFPPGVGERLRALGHEVLEVSEEDLLFSYEFARPAAAGVSGASIRSGGIHPFAQGFVAGT